MPGTTESGGSDVEAAHTPGPWKSRLDEGKNLFVIKSASGQQLATCSPPMTGLPVANAQLIAAAPELLKACRDCQEVMNATARLFVDDDHPGRAELHARADQLDVYAMRARAAIAKATGSPSH